MYIHAKVKVKAKREELKELKKDHFEISVKEPAERNLANGRVLELLSAHFGLPKGKIRIINGHQSSSKLISADVDQTL